jgi:hypothetical protein
MRRIRFGTNFAIFILFFGVAARLTVLAGAVPTVCTVGYIYAVRVADSKIARSQAWHQSLFYKCPVRKASIFVRVHLTEQNNEFR